MAGDERGFMERLNPFSQMRNRWDNARAHPVQTGISTILGLVNPALGMGSRAAFNRFNDRRFDNATQRNNARVGEIGDEAGRAAMERPLDGPLGQFESRGGQNPIVGALMGQPYGGQQALSSGGYNVQQHWAQQQPQSILGAMPQSGVPQLDLSGLDAALEARGGGQGGMNMGAGWSGVMGPGAGGQALIRGMQQFGSAGAGGSTRFYNRDQGSSSAQ